MFYYRALPIIGAAACLGVAITRREVAPQLHESMHSMFDRITCKRKADVMSQDESLARDEDETEEECEPAKDWLLLFPTRSADGHAEDGDQRPTKRVRFSQASVPRNRRRYVEGISFVRLPHYPKAPERCYVCRGMKLDDYVCWQGGHANSADAASIDTRQEVRPAKASLNGKRVDELTNTHPAASAATTARRARVPPHVSRLLEIDRHLSDCAGLLANVPLPSALANVEVEEGQIVG